MFKATGLGVQGEDLPSSGPLPIPLAVCPGASPWPSLSFRFPFYHRGTIIPTLLGISVLGGGTAWPHHRSRCLLND